MVVQGWIVGRAGAGAGGDNPVIILATGHGCTGQHPAFLAEPHPPGPSPCIVKYSASTADFQSDKNLNVILAII